ncbi:DUF4082 domain-containing protein [Saccharothrix longispora]|uniref:DUF4082 domain-containing protein n=1 Tax=Saccharothrix longispora TaxID=33920 RepID=A0ABU1PVQ1_9PSEU|nr:DUF4082 domain-containing protein [Saccharothrix longispora]MDR6594706.1 hypothetical protein [Saccharothrix longispora]
MSRLPRLLATAAVAALVLSGSAQAYDDPAPDRVPAHHAAPADAPGTAPAAPTPESPLGPPGPRTVSCAEGCEFVTRPAPEVAAEDVRPTEVGVRTVFDRPGHVLGASLLRGPHRGPITLRLWRDGALLAERAWTHPGRMAEIFFATPVPVEAGREYVISYYTPYGGYLTSPGYYTAPVTYGPFTAPVGAGVLHHGEGGGFPTENHGDSTYWINPEFRG